MSSRRRLANLVRLPSHHPSEMARSLAAYEVFYPAAALYAAVALPASVLAMTGATSAPQALSSPAGHAHEMLLGFALAVVAGNQLGPVHGPAIGWLLLLWIAARGAFLLAPGSLIALLLNAVFAGALAFRVVPRLTTAAKKWRNRALPAVIAALASAAVAWELSRCAANAGVPASLVLATVALFALLMLFMGGRIIAPAVAGQFLRQGARLDAPVQPRVEAALLVAGASFAVAQLLPGLQIVAVLAGGATGALAAIRLIRWRLWEIRGRPDLWCLSAGYGWLSLGLLATAGSIACGCYVDALVHLITIGALGTLTFNVMAMFWRLKSRRGLMDANLIVWGTALLAAATGARVLGAFESTNWLYVAAGCWAMAFTLLLVLFWRDRRRYVRKDGV